jgi:small subunit ribosomal protein S17
MVRRQKIGIVISNKMDKSIVIITEMKYKHSVYGKIMSKTRRYMAHDPENKTQMGDTVVVEEHPPLSAKKRWILKTILK